MSQEKSFVPPQKGIRWGWIVAGLVVVAMIAFFFLNGVEGNIQYYMTASEYKQQQPKYEGKKLKLAGRVKLGSLKSVGEKYDFVIEDLGKEISVTYLGQAPDTFKDGSDVVVEGRGRLDDKFEAISLMAKCASKYQAGGLPPLEQMRSKSIR
ncbi:MAG: ccmE [Bacteriovoracaceae bacterium]|nr:ccmE [Bacteriovoracaceae bacterium]